jgi:hypothetical protein
VCCVRAAQVLAGRPELYATKPLKALRTALHALTQSKALEAGGKSLVGRVSDALRDERWDDALQALQVRAARRQWHTVKPLKIPHGATTRDAMHHQLYSHGTECTVTATAT